LSHAKHDAAIKYAPNWKQLKEARETLAKQKSLEWFRRQIFGQKSERFVTEPDPMQMYLGEARLSADYSLSAKSGSFVCARRFFEIVMPHMSLPPRLLRLACRH
jgi:Transposase C of IS166 homeodomain